MSKGGCRPASGRVRGIRGSGRPRRVDVGGHGWSRISGLRRPAEGRWLISPAGLYSLGRLMLRRILSTVLLLLLCLPATSLAVLYTCAMDGLTRMSNCDEHAEHRARVQRSVARPVAQAGGHGCAAVPETCCESRVVTASLETAPSNEIPTPSAAVGYVASVADAGFASGGVGSSLDAPRWRGPPLYARFASYLI